MGFSHQQATHALALHNQDTQLAIEHLIKIHSTTPTNAALDISHGLSTQDIARKLELAKAEETHRINKANSNTQLLHYNYEDVAKLRKQQKELAEKQKAKERLERMMLLRENQVAEREREELRKKQRFELESSFTGKTCDTWLWS
jgi:hypothetical protein